MSAEGLSPVTSELAAAQSVQSSAVHASVAALSCAALPSALSREAASRRRMKTAEASAAAKDQLHRPRGAQGRVRPVRGSGGVARCCS